MWPFFVCFKDFLTFGLLFSYLFWLYYTILYVIILFDRFCSAVVVLFLSLLIITDQSLCSHGWNYGNHHSPLKLQRWGGGVVTRISEGYNAYIPLVILIRWGCPSHLARPWYRVWLILCLFLYMWSHTYRTVRELNPFL